MKPRLILDVDGVIADIHEKAMRLFLAETGIPLKREMFTTWKFKNLPVVGAAFERYIDTPGFYREMNLYPGALRFVEIANDLTELTIATAVRPKAAAGRIDWLFEKFPYLRPNQVKITHDKGDLQGEIIIDDAPHNLEVGERVMRLMPSQPWNLHETRFSRIPGDSYWNPGYTLMYYVLDNYKVNEYTARRRSAHHVSKVVL